MMPRDPWAKVRPGDRMEGIPAQVWNAMIDAAKIAKQQSETAAGLGAAGGRLLVLNTTGATIDRFAAVAISDLVYDPTSSTQAKEAFDDELVLKITTAAISYYPNCAITLEPIAANEVGWAAVDGIVSAQVDIVSSADRFADVVDGQTYLRSQTGGLWEIVAKPSGTGTKWCKVRRGSGLPTRLGKTAGTHTKGLSGTINVYRGGTPGSEANTGSYTISAYNRFGTISGGKWVRCEWDNGHWEIVAAECT